MLLARMPCDNAGFVSWYLSDKGISGAVFRSVFERRAPELLVPMEAAIGAQIKQGTSLRPVSPRVLSLLLDAYRAARTEPGVREGGA